jgi:hypothetical protein
MGGVLIKSAMVASSCFHRISVNSSESCNDLHNHGHMEAFHSALPERIDFLIWTSKSCLPNGVTGYMGGKDYSNSGLPQYVANATIEKHIPMVMKLAC